MPDIAPKPTTSGNQRAADDDQGGLAESQTPGGLNSQEPDTGLLRPSSVTESFRLNHLLWPIWGLLILGLVFALREARSIAFPITAAFLLTLILRPILCWLNRFRIPDVVGASLAMMMLLGVTAFGFAFLLEPARVWIKDAPRHIQAVQIRLQDLEERMNLILKPDGKPDNSQDDEEIRPVPVEIQASQWETYVWFLSDTGKLAVSALLILVLTFFISAFNRPLINGVLQLLSRWSDKKRAVELLHQLEDGVTKYLFTITILNICLGIVVGVAMWLLGLPNPVLWAVMATLFNYIPHLGAILGTLVLWIVSLLSFDSPAFAIVPPLVYLVLTSLEGSFLAPAILGKSMRFNPILILLWLVFWGWLWGIGGAVIAVPLLAVFKLVCEVFEKTQPIAGFIQE